MLPAADDVRVLATSREPIGLAGEVRFRLRPLATGMPNDPEVPAAVRLFADRAQQADPRFVLDRESGLVAARLVQRLDGMPLAIELAAARVEALGLSQLLDRLEGSLRLLTSADRTAPARHRHSPPRWSGAIGCSGRRTSGSSAGWRLSRSVHPGGRRGGGRARH